MKKRLSVLLVLCLLLSVCAAPVALAAGVTVLSTQNLAVDGKTIPCEKYNIDGSNYFKLRDMAYLLNGTGSQFAVGWDAASSTVSITTGQPYTPNGTELKLDGGDKSATSVPSSQTIKIDGVVVSNLSVYNIGGNNYFKLRDLGTALGFEVGYDAATFTATVTTAKEMVWQPVKEICVNKYGETVYEYTYDALGRIVRQQSGNYEIAYSYNGNIVTEEVCYGTEKYSTITTTYDDNGRLIIDDTVLYDDNNVAMTRHTSYYDYDEHGNVISDLWMSGDPQTGDSYVENISNYTNTYDADGNLIKVLEEGDYQTITHTYTYLRGKLIRKQKVYDSGKTYKYVYGYDQEGRLITEQVDDWSSYTIHYTYDANGNMVKSVQTDYNDDGTTDVTTTTIEYAQFPKAQ